MKAQEGGGRGRGGARVRGSGQDENSVPNSMMHGDFSSVESERFPSRRLCITDDRKSFPSRPFQGLHPFSGRWHRMELVKTFMETRGGWGWFWPFGSGLLEIWYYLGLTLISDASSIMFNV